MSAVTLGIGAVGLALLSTVIIAAAGTAKREADIEAGRLLARVGDVVALLAVAVGFWAGRASL